MIKDSFRVDPPLAALSPVVYDAPHAGRTYPLDFDHAIDLSVLRQVEDTHVEALFAHVTQHGSPLLYALLPRTYLDVNRAVDDLDVDMIAGTWPLPVQPTDFSAQGIGLLWRHIGVDGPIYARKLAVEEVLKRIYYVWRPYHEQLEQLIDAAHQRFGISYHINCHSMPSREAGPSRETGIPEDARSRPARTDFVLGDRDGTTCEGDLVRHVRDTLRELGYQVAINDPYKGAELLRRYGRPAEGRHSLQIEINRRLYMDEQTRARNGFYGKLTRDLDVLTRSIAEYALRKAGQDR